MEQRKYNYEDCFFVSKVLIIILCRDTEFDKFCDDCLQPMLFRVGI